MLGRDGPYRFQFDEDSFKTNEIGAIALPKQTALVFQRERLKRFEGNTALGKLDRKTFLIHRLQESRAHRAIDLEHRPADTERVALIEETSVLSVFSVAHPCSLAADAGENNTRT